MGEYVIKLPDVGEGVAEAELVEWMVKEGANVREDEVLAAVMTDKAREQARKAYELRDRASEMEKLAIESQYHSLVTGDADKAIAALEVWKQTYPRDERPANNLAVRLMQLGRFERAADEAQEAMRRNPNNVFPRTNLAGAFLGLNRFDEAKAVLEKAAADKLIQPANANLYQIAFVQGDAAAMRRVEEAARGTFRLGIVGLDNLTAFEQKIGFVSTRKRSALRGVIAAHTGRASSRTASCRTRRATD